MADREAGDLQSENENCQFINDSSLEYLKKQEGRGESVHIYGMDAFEFMMMDMDAVMRKVHTVAGEQEKPALIRLDMIRMAVEADARRGEEERRKQFERDFPEMSLLDIFSSGQLSRTRREVIRELIQANVEEKTIKNIIFPKLTEAEVQEKKRAWMEMWGNNVLS